MKQGSIALLLTALLAQESAPAADPQDVVAGGYLSPERYPGMELVWREEFEGKALDEGRWERVTGRAEGAALQSYEPDKLRIADGYLRIIARSEQDGQSASGRLVARSPRRFAGHRIDVRLALPEGPGLTSSVRLRGAQEAGLDIVEMIGGDGRENTVHGTLRWRESGQSRYESGSMTLPGDSFTGQFHVFSVVWDDAQIRWLADGHEWFRYPFAADDFDLSRQALQIVLDLAVGGDRVGNPDENTGFPQQLVVDYIRIFQRLP